MEKFLICFLASLSDPKNIRKKFEKNFFHSEKLIFLKISRASCHPKMGTRNKPQHPNSKYPEQTLTLNPLVPGTNLVTQPLGTRNKPGHSNPWYPEQTWSLKPLVPGTNLVTQSLSTRNKPCHPVPKYPEQTWSLTC